MDQVVVKVLGEYQRRTMTVQEMDTEGNVLATSTQYVPASPVLTGNGSPVLRCSA